MPNNISITGDGTFNSTAVNEGTVDGIVQISEYGVNKSTVKTGIFTDHALNNTGATVSHSASFANNSENAGTVAKNAVLAGAAKNSGTITGNVVLKENAVNTGTIVGKAQIDGANVTAGTVTGGTTIFIPWLADASYEYHVLEKTGTVTQATETGGIKGLDTSADGYISITKSGDSFEFGLGDFTIDLFVKLNNTDSDQVLLGYNGTDADYQGWAIYCASGVGSSLVGFVADTGGNTAIWETDVSDHTINAGDWHHVAVVRSAGTFSLYVDGIRSSVNSSNQGSAIVPLGAGTGVLRIGAFIDGDLRNLDGVVSNIRIVKGRALYSGATCTVPTALFTTTAGLQLLSNFGATAMPVTSGPYTTFTVYGDTNSHALYASTETTSMAAGVTVYTDVELTSAYTGMFGYDSTIYYANGSGLVALANGYYSTGYFVDGVISSTTAGGHAAIDDNGAYYYGSDGAVYSGTGYYSTGRYVEGVISATTPGIETAGNDGTKYYYSAAGDALPRTGYYSTGYFSNGVLHSTTAGIQTAGDDNVKYFYGSDGTAYSGTGYNSTGYYFEGVLGAGTFSGEVHPAVDGGYYYYGTDGVSYSVSGSKYFTTGHFADGVLTELASPELHVAEDGGTYKYFYSAYGNAYSSAGYYSTGYLEINGSNGLRRGNSGRGVYYAVDNNVPYYYGGDGAPYSPTGYFSTGHFIDGNLAGDNAPYQYSGYYQAQDDGNYRTYLSDGNVDGKTGYYIAGYYDGGARANNPYVGVHSTQDEGMSYYLFFYANGEASNSPGYYSMAYFTYDENAPGLVQGTTTPGIHTALDNSTLYYYNAAGFTFSSTGYYSAGHYVNGSLAATTAGIYTLADVYPSQAVFGTDGSIQTQIDQTIYLDPVGNKWHYVAAGISSGLCDGIYYDETAAKWYNFTQGVKGSYPSAGKHRAGYPGSDSKCGTYEFDASGEATKVSNSYLYYSGSDLVRYNVGSNNSTETVTLGARLTDSTINDGYDGTFTSYSGAYNQSVEVSINDCDGNLNSFWFTGAARDGEAHLFGQGLYAVQHYNGNWGTWSYSAPYYTNNSYYDEFGNYIPVCDSSAGSQGFTPYNDLIEPNPGHYLLVNNGNPIRPALGAIINAGGAGWYEFQKDANDKFVLGRPSGIKRSMGYDGTYGGGAWGSWGGRFYNFDGSGGATLITSGLVQGQDNKWYNAADGGYPGNYWQASDNAWYLYDNVGGRANVTNTYNYGVDKNGVQKFYHFTPNNSAALATGYFTSGYFDNGVKSSTPAGIHEAVNNPGYYYSYSSDGTATGLSGYYSDGYYSGGQRASISGFTTSAHRDVQQANDDSKWYQYASNGSVVGYAPIFSWDINGFHGEYSRGWSDGDGNLTGYSAYLLTWAPEVFLRGSNNKYYITVTGTFATGTRYVAAANKWYTFDGNGGGVYASSGVRAATNSLYYKFDGNGGAVAVSEIAYNLQSDSKWHNYVNGNDQGLITGVYVRSSSSTLPTNSGGDDKLHSFSAGVDNGTVSGLYQDVSNSNKWTTYTDGVKGSTLYGYYTVSGDVERFYIDGVRETTVFGPDSSTAVVSYATHQPVGFSLVTGTFRYLREDPVYTNLQASGVKILENGLRYTGTKTFDAYSYMRDMCNTVITNNRVGEPNEQGCYAYDGGNAYFNANGTFTMMIIDGDFYTGYTSSGYYVNGFLTPTTAGSYQANDGAYYYYNASGNVENINGYYSFGYYVGGKKTGVSPQAQISQDNGYAHFYGADGTAYSTPGRYSIGTYFQCGGYPPDRCANSEASGFYTAIDDGQNYYYAQNAYGSLPGTGYFSFGYYSNGIAASLPAGNQPGSRTALDDNQSYYYKADGSVAPASEYLSTGYYVYGERANLPNQEAVGIHTADNNSTDYFYGFDGTAYSSTGYYSRGYFNGGVRDGLTSITNHFGADDGVPYIYSLNGEPSYVIGPVLWADGVTGKTYFVPLSGTPSLFTGFSDGKIYVAGVTDGESAVTQTLYTNTAFTETVYVATDANYKVLGPISEDVTGIWFAAGWWSGTQYSDQGELGISFVTYVDGVSTAEGYV